LKFLLDENVSVPIKDVIHDLGFNVYALHDFNRLGIQNGEVFIKFLKKINYFKTFKYLLIIINLNKG